MPETKVLVWNMPAHEFTNARGALRMVDVNIATPEIISQIGEGWRAVNHSAMVVGSGVLVSVLVERIER